ncbi:PGM, partial [Symbiodinium sp. CCMP2592]
ASPPHRKFQTAPHSGSGNWLGTSITLLAAQALWRSPQGKSWQGRQDTALPRSSGPTLAAGFEATRPGRRRKWVYFIRHGEALVNAAGRVFAKDDPRKKAVRQDMQYFDSRLSEKGLEQARALRASVPKVDIVAASPLTRALQTATAVFGCDEPGGPKLHAVEALREFCGKQYQPCDSRRPTEELKADFPHVDFSQVPPGADDLLGPGKVESIESVDARIQKLFTWLRDQPHEAVGCVAHFQILSRIFAEHLEPAGLDGSCYGPYANLE